MYNYFMKVKYNSFNKFFHDCVKSLCQYLYYLNMLNMNLVMRSYSIIIHNKC